MFMNNYQLNALATRALVDPAFTRALLNGQRRQKLLEFDISSELVDVIMSIPGNDIHQFISELHELVASQEWTSPPKRDPTGSGNHA